MRTYVYRVLETVELFSTCRRGRGTSKTCCPDIIQTKDGLAAFEASDDASWVSRPVASMVTSPSEASRRTPESIGSPDRLATAGSTDFSSAVNGFADVMLQRSGHLGSNEGSSSRRSLCAWGFDQQRGVVRLEELLPVLHSQSLKAVQLPEPLPFIRLAVKELDVQTDPRIPSFSETRATRQRMPLRGAPGMATLSCCETRSRSREREIAGSADINMLFVSRAATRTANPPRCSSHNKCGDEPSGENATGPRGSAEDQWERTEKEVGDSELTVSRELSQHRDCDPADDARQEDDDREPPAPLFRVVAGHRRHRGSIAPIRSERHAPERGAAPARVRSASRA